MTGLASRLFLNGAAALIISMSAPLPALGAYLATVLYPLTPPSGLQLNVLDYLNEGQALGTASVIGNKNGNSYDALLWSGPTGSVVDLTPSGFTNASVAFTNGVQQVGAGTAAAPAISGHALLWTGTAASAVDLNPTDLIGFTFSAADGIGGAQQVGYGGGTGPPGDDALLWYGTAASAVDLTPTNLSGFFNTSAVGTDGKHQVGSGEGIGTGYKTHALLWSGSAASAVDLNPTNLSGFNSSTAQGVYGNQQVGYGSVSGSGNKTHASLWYGTADSAVDLNPTNLPNFVSSAANGTNGVEQVGTGFTTIGGQDHALLWFGTADSAVDLHSLLPSSGRWFNSFAYGVDSAGDIFGSANGSFNGVSGNFAVEWSPLPEPDAAVLWMTASVGLLARRRHTTN